MDSRSILITRLPSDANSRFIQSELDFRIFKDKRLQIARINRFVADGHLGKLARNLRLLGFDVAYDAQARRSAIARYHGTRKSGASDARSAFAHARGGKDRLLPAFTKRRRTNVEVIRRFDLLDSIAPFTRCLRCNAPLRKVSKTEIIERLEPLTKIYYEQFRRCTGCEQIYWPGSHFSKLQKRLEKIRANCRERSGN